jgi:uncharacterized protein
VRAAGVGGDVVPVLGHLNTLILKLTKACNYACAYCYDLEHDDAIGNMSVQTALASVEEGLRLAQRITPESPDLLVLLHGGEPMLRFGLIKEIVTKGKEAAARLGKTIFFCGQTNLSRLTREIVDFTNEHQIHWGVSLDGPPSLNDTYRVFQDGRGTYAAYERAMEQFPDFVRACAVLSVITKHNQDHLLEIARHFKSVGVPGWDWTLFQPIGMGRQHAEQFGCSDERVIQGWNDLFGAVERGEFDGFRVGPILDYLEGFVSATSRNMCQRKDCGAARDLISVGHDGTIDACDCIDRRGPYSTLGTIQIQTRDSIERARASEKAVTIRSRDVERGQCGECLWLAVCGGSCFAHAESLHGVAGQQCAITMNAFDKISRSIASHDALRRYWLSVGSVLSSVAPAAASPN